MAKKALHKRLKLAYEDIEREVVKGEEIVVDTIDAKTQKAILNQVDEEYRISYDHNEAKRAIWLMRLKLYNNQRKLSDAVGDPLMFTIFNTVLAALYDDRLTAVWEGRGGQGDEDVENNLNALASYDYDIMVKNEMDYDWMWDAAFFGRGLVQMTDFDRSKGVMAPIPEVIDPTVFVRDPRASSVNGNRRGKGSMRFGGYESGATYYELKKLPAYFNLSSLKKDKEVRSMLVKTRQERATAQGVQDFPNREDVLGKYNNYEFNLLNWFTTIKGKKYLLTLGNSRTTLVRMVELKYDDVWPLVDRALYPMSHDWDGVSIPDLTEDKQRMRSVLLNLGIKGTKADVMPRFLFDGNRIKNKNDLNYRSNKYIKVDGRVDNAMMPVQTTNSINSAALILDILDTASQRATATPETQQGVPVDQQRTLGEIQLVSSKVDTRYSLNAKIFGWSERRFWRQWYRQYKLHFKDKIDEKVLRVQGALAPVWRPLLRENIIADVDPDVRIESRIISEAKKIREQQGFDALAGFLLQDPSVNRRYVQKKLAKLRGMDKEELDLTFPPTVDEMQAEDENDVLNAGRLPTISVEDDHQTHIMIHAKANASHELLAHIRAHKKLMITARDRPDLIPPDEAPGFAQPGSNQVGAQTGEVSGRPSPAPVA